MSFNRALFLGVAALASFGVARAQAPAAEAAPSEATASEESAVPLMSLRTATVDQLASLDHVDVGTAEAIIALRESRNGRLGTVEELRVLPGIEAATLDSLRMGTAVEFELPVGARKTYSSVEEVLAEFAHEPTVLQVQQWATDYARLNASMVDRWIASSQSFALLPELRLEYRFRDGWEQD
ncbi:MAG: helix-hairpin-helix domain-containing protein, partial [Deltaproteobacteria bacterium]|nr:helix-hairpin-helix domain-containing protein [Deltaproteobacteria bacterium]